jgi:hypothetical protein
LEAERRKASRESSNACDFPVFHHRTACAQCRQIDIWIILGKIGFEWFSAHAEGFLKAVGRKPSGEGSSEVFDARTLRKLLDILTHRAACAAPLSFAD